MRFSVKKVEVLLFLAFFCLFSALGIWQLQRADEKREIAQRINARSQAQALVLEGPVDWDKDQIEYQKISVRGEFNPRGQLLIDNILRAGQAGYEVITPLRISGSDWHILVNRGWVAQGQSRQVFPRVTLPTGEVSLSGIVRSPSHLPFVDSSATGLDQDAAFNLWLYLDLDKYRDESGLNILPFAMLQDSDSGDGLIRDWPMYQAKTAMHLGYALQWFAFALIVTLIFVGLGRRRGRKPNGEDGQEK